ncbi:hypothetical protein EIP91_010553 [Steccherinum ochraceum]|uniref:Protein kinase domain-containing protein n=1 Tax=Steccherinum ochraceum TaxID=92696 RepID=A0A4R0R313_9APHY|nr:hypothetical protein EIP91_010553 [Steccherinum ochraceum]
MVAYIHFNLNGHSSLPTGHPGLSMMPSMSDNLAEGHFDFEVTQRIQTEALDQGLNRNVLIGTLSSSDGQHDAPFCAAIPEWNRQTMVCKLAWGHVQVERLQKEAQNYSAHSHLQGKVIPRCYGFFFKEDIACVLLEHVGSSLKPRDASWDELLEDYHKIRDRDLRYNIMNTLHVYFHKNKLEHGDFVPKHVVFAPDGTTFRFIDLASMHEHDGGECQGPEPKSLLPTFYRVPCKELYSVGVAMECYWQRYQWIVKVADTRVTIQDFESEESLKQCFLNIPHVGVDMGMNGVNAKTIRQAVEKYKKNSPGNRAPHEMIQHLKKLYGDYESFEDSD